MSDRAARAGILLLCAASLAIGVVAARDTARFVGQNEPGFLVFSNGFLSAPFLFADRRGADAAGATVLDLVVAVDGVAVGSAREIWAAVGQSEPGHTHRYTLERPSGARFEAAIASRRFEAEDRVRLLALCAIPALLLLAITSAIALSRPRLESARALFAFGWALSTGFGMLASDHLLSQRMTPWSYALGSLSIGALLHLALIFPERRVATEPTPRGLLAAIYGIPLALLALYLIAYQRSPASTYVLDLAAAAGYLVGTVAFAGNLLWTALRSPSPLGRLRARVVALAPLAGILAAAVAAGLRVASVREIAAIGFVASIGALPAAMAVAIARRNLFELDAPAQRVISAGAAGAASATVYGVILWIARGVIGANTPGAAALISLVCLLLVVAAVGALRGVVERGLRALLFPSQRDAQRVLRKVTAEFARLHDPEALARLVSEATQRGLGAAWACVVETGPDGAVRVLGGADRSDWADALEVPIPVASGGASAIRAGFREDGRSFTRDDQQWLATLASRCSVAFENGHAWEHVRALQERLARENEILREEAALHHEFAEFVGRSPEMRRVLAQIEQVAPVYVVVLVTGETGTGKELVAHAIHSLSPRRDGPLVKLACGAVPETLFESELFGHERGAFTGANTSRAGHFEAAHRGTLFLDDVDTLPLAVQAKLLRALQEGEVQRLGAAEPRSVDVRVVAATNLDLMAAVRAGRFREDLYYRLNVVPIQLPPLRERGDDVLLLAEYFAGRIANGLGRETRPLSASARDAIRNHNWPGNVRELHNAVERAVVLSVGPELEIAAPSGPGDGVARQAPADGALSESVRLLKISLIERAMAKCGGRQSEAAPLLGLHAQSLSRMMKELGLRAG